MGDRVEKDSLGEVRIPEGQLYGASTQRAVENFGVSGIRFPRCFIRALGLIKLAAAKINSELGLLEEATAKAIEAAAESVANGAYDDHFVVDVFQTGSGTSTNMNANEVIASVAAISLGGKSGDRGLVHPNDHVNMGQSSNDVFPAAIHVTALCGIVEDLIPAAALLRECLERKSNEFAGIVKSGRTHLQDAVPVTLGQEFGGYARQIEQCIGRIESGLGRLSELPLGGTAVGTGLNTHPQFGKRIAEEISRLTGHAFAEAANHFEAQASKDTCVEVSGSLRVLAVALDKIAGDIRWLACGPRAGFSELVLPAVQPGSSIMPGKVNPVIPEMVIQVAAQVVGNDFTVTLGGRGGRFELNHMMPVIAHNLLQSVTILTSACRIFTARCVEGLKADAERCRSTLERNLMLATALAPEIGYDRAAEIAKEAYSSGRTIREVLEAKDVLPRKRIDALLDVMRMVRRKP
jgi:fumarate hydratase class II